MRSPTPHLVAYTHAGEKNGGTSSAPAPRSYYKTRELQDVPGLTCAELAFLAAAFDLRLAYSRSNLAVSPMSKAIV
jgi:hypothetical protein